MYLSYFSCLITVKSLASSKVFFETKFSQFPVKRITCWSKECHCLEIASIRKLYLKCSNPYLGMNDEPQILLHS